MKGYFEENDVNLFVHVNGIKIKLYSVYLCTYLYIMKYALCISQNRMHNYDFDITLFLF